MSLTTTCLLDAKSITIDTALKLRAEANVIRGNSYDFQCIECWELVDPHKKGAGSPARFEHRVRNDGCKLSRPQPLAVKKTAGAATNGITTLELALRTAGGIDYIRTKGGVVKGLALKRQLNRDAPEIIVVGKGPNIQARAALFLESGISVPTYIKRGTNVWELIGQYRAVEYRTDKATINRHSAGRDAANIAGIAGILFTERTDEVDVNIRGGGFADSAARKAVESAAVDFVIEHFEAQGYVVEDRQRDNLGYDLLATKRSSTLKLEVKGTGGPVSRFFLTRNEWKCAAAEADWRLAIVTNARTAPQMQVLTAQEVDNSYMLDTLAWECTPHAA